MEKPLNVLLFPYNAPETPIPPVTTKVPVVYDDDAVAAVNVVAPFEVKVVKAPVPLVVEPILEESIVLFVRLSDPAKVARVPVVGRVTPVVPVEVKVIALAPDVTRLPPRVMVLAPLFTPVPP